MKILLINDYGTPTGGAELSELALRNQLRQRGHDARLFASSARPENADSEADFECRGTTSRWRTLLQTANPWAYWRLRQVLREFRPDVVHVRMFLTQLSPLILPLLKDIPSIFHVAWYRPLCPLGTKLFPDGSECRVHYGAVCYRGGCLPLRDWVPLMLQMKLWRRWRHKFTAIVANSHEVKERLREGGFTVKDTIWLGVPVRPKRPPLTPPPLVGFAGRLVRVKGLDVLLRSVRKVFTEVPDARLLIVGDGPERGRLSQMTADLGLSAKVRFTGFRPRAEMENLLASAWVQVVPSLWAEPFGLVAAEGMMRGTAVVASGSGGLKEIVRDGQTGLLVAPGNAAALAESLLRLLRDQQLAERMGECGRQVALEHFSESKYVERCIRLYETLCSEKSRQ